MEEFQMQQTENIPLEELNAKLAKLESVVNTFTRQSDLTAQFELEYKLLDAGLTRGANGVAAAFTMFTLIFLANGFFYYKNGGALMSSLELLGLAGILASALLIYFAFIFRFTFKLVADWKERKVDISTAKGDGAQNK
jgi:hypothetical protein